MTDLETRLRRTKRLPEAFGERNPDIPVVDWVNPDGPEAADELTRLKAELCWIGEFADIRSQDDSKTFARVNRGALRTIRDRARSALLHDTSKGDGYDGERLKEISRQTVEGDVRRMREAASNGGDRPDQTIERLIDSHDKEAANREDK